MSIDKATFEHRFNQLMEITIQRLESNKYSSSENSFLTGVWFDEGGYKRQVWEEAKKVLAAELWGSPNDPSIIRNTLNTMSILMQSGDQQNLVSIPNINKAFDAFYARLQETAQCIYDLYKSVDDSNDEKIFTALTKFLETNLMIRFRLLRTFSF